MNPLMQRIIDDPHDIAARLVYSDWLEENGGMERAEFIRVQCELASLPPCKSPDLCPISKDARHQCYPCQQSLHLRRRERGLWPREGMVGGLVGGNGVEWKYRRGFVESICCRLEDWIGRKCPECEDGWATFNRGGSGMVCQRCDGTGRIDAHGPAIVAAQPVVEVVITNRRPLYYEHDPYMPYRWGSSHVILDTEWYIPFTISNLLRWAEKPYYYIYATAAEAMADLSRACIAWARQRAKLPPLPGSPSTRASDVEDGRPAGLPPE